MSAVSSASRSPRKRGRLSAPEWGLIAATLLILFAAHIAYGANKDVLGVLLAAAEALLLAGALASPRFAGELWAQRRALAGPAVLYLLTILIAAHPLYWPNRHRLEDLSGVTRETIKLLGLGAVFLVGIVLASRGRRAEMTLKLSGVLLGVYAAYAVGAFKLTPDVLLFGPKMMFPDRLTGTFGSANSAATLLGVGVVLNAAMALKPGDGGRKGASAVWSALALGACLVCAAALFMTASRSGFVATILGLAVVGGGTLSVQKHAPKLRSMLIGGAGLIIVAAGLFASNSLLATRLIGTNSIDRIDIIKAHWPMALVHPFSGFGLGNFEAIHNQTITPENYSLMWNIRATHNVYLQWAEETGFVCLLLITAAIGWLLVRTLSGVRRDAARPHVNVAVLGVSAVVLVHGLMDFGLQNPSIAAVWALCLGCAQPSLDRSSTRRG